MLQKYCKCTPVSPTCCRIGWRLVLAGSRFLNDAESRYAPIEGEALAVSDSLDKCRMFVTGCPYLVVASDHKPLIKILGDKSLEKITNPRLFSIKEKTLPYDFQIIHVDGKINMAADACSRNPTQECSAVNGLVDNTIYDVIRRRPSELECYESQVIDNKMQCLVVASLTSRDTLNGAAKAVTIERLKTESNRDVVINSLIEYIKDGFPDDKTRLPVKLQCYFNIRNELTVLDGLVLYGIRIVVPLSLRAEILEILHSAHQGVTGMKNRAKQCVYWPGLNGDINNRQLQCQFCRKISPSQPSEPLILNTSPAYPFEKVVADYFFMNGRHYLLYADRYSGWISIVKVGSGEGNSKYLKQHLRKLFSVYGTPFSDRWWPTVYFS